MSLINKQKFIYSEKDTIQKNFAKVAKDTT